MEFHKPDYISYLIIGPRGPSPVYDWTVWQPIAHLLDPLVQASRGKAGVRSSQLSGVMGAKRLYPFGRLGWDEKSHQKWTHHSPVNDAVSADWDFLNTEIWVPHWNQCVREDRAPDVFIAINGLRDRFPNHQAILFAVEKRWHADEESMVRAIVSGIADRMTPCAVGVRLSPWGETSGSGFDSALQDIPMSICRYEGVEIDSVPDVRRLYGNWERCDI